MIKRTIEISSGPCRLHVRNGQLVVERPEEGEKIVPSDDIGVLLLDNPAITITQGVFNVLAEKGAVIVTCGPDHHPAAVHMPLTGHAEQTRRHIVQIETKEPLKKRLWQSIVAAKIRMQGLTLRHCNARDEGLEAFSKTVRSGDPDNREAQAAQRYWPALLGKDFRRFRGGLPPNNFLNYGYMVLRAAMARAVCAAGLIPALGLHHHNRNNAFCLADDLMEVFRPCIDLRVVEIVQKNMAQDDLNREHKRILLGALQDALPIGGERRMMASAMQTLAQSLARSFEEAENRLVLPTGLPESVAMDHFQIRLDQKTGVMPAKAGIHLVETQMDSRQPKRGSGNDDNSA